jgi:carbamoyltransferase
MSTDTYVLGINYRPAANNDIGHHPAAALLKNGKIIAMCQEERFTRIKEAPGRFPLRAAQFCLQNAGITVREVSAVGWNWDPPRSAERSKQKHNRVMRGLASTTQFALRHTPLRGLGSLLVDSILPERAVRDFNSQLLFWLGIANIPVFCFDHHLAHAASAYFSSGFTRGTVVTWDCWGDHLSGLIARGQGSQLEVLEEFPYSRFSIGLLNEFVYDFLRTSEKGNLMGLAPYGTPRGLIDGLVDVPNLKMRVDLLEQRAPFPAAFLERAGSPRRSTDELEQRHKDVAAELQQIIECLCNRKLVMRAEHWGQRIWLTFSWASRLPPRS